jgi:protein tyrosine/serine phosphatase
MRAGKLMWPILLAVSLVAAGSVGGIFVWKQYFDSYHLATVQDGVLYRDGVRKPRQFERALQRVKPRTIVSLVDDSEIAREPFVSEVNYCRANGIDLVRIPITLGGWPSGDDVQKFLAIVADPARRPVLVHCAQGVRRTGMMVAAYQETVMGFDRDRAKAALLAFGHSRRTVGDVERFIDVYDPVGRRMNQALPMSSE